ncbi:Peptidyl-tRNA hydrolase [Cyphellophora attinorum]|uniref:peptidyl-tRNA hydrolase n=1 Tax=Cyphellophora attinorum TaxID=1664694 RepID=A0A0N1HB84_9EURO|nr:Peptidyl-tRNA hydrolase [Phialophora attinorum]KPI41520.1 Peptidyl-tRNA hydrolase [Phialophora attinorum]
MSNESTGSASPLRGRQRRRSTSPLHQVHTASSDDSYIESDADDHSSRSSPAPVPNTLRHRRNSSRIDDVAPLKIKKKPLKGKPYLSVNTMQLSSPRSVRLLIASIGNVKPYHSTRHSAGHFLLDALRVRLGIGPLVKSNFGLMRSGVDAGHPQYTLWQSVSAMNVSGEKLLKAWKAFAAEHDQADTVTGLVVLHDELELVPGKLKLRRGPTSPAGHNGIRSIQDKFHGNGIMKQLVDKRYFKIGIGIGRPVSRDKDQVSGYVLGQLTGKEKQEIASKGDELVQMLDREVETLSTSA